MAAATTTSAKRARRRQRREESRAQILAAANDALRRIPYRELTIDDVMAPTGLSRTVFYRHFADLPDLVLGLMRETGLPMLESSIEMAAAPEDPARVRAGLEAIIGFWAEHGPLVWAVSHAAVDDEEIEALWDRFIERFVSLTADGIERAVARGAMRPVVARPTAEALTAMNVGYLLRAFGREPAGDPAVALDTLWTIWDRTLYERER